MNDDFIDNANNLYFSEVENEDGLSVELNEALKSNLAGLIESRFASAEQARDYDETRWINAYHNFRGMYGKHVPFRESEKSKVFIKITTCTLIKKCLRELRQVQQRLLECKIKQKTHLK